jgi:hypothetical protein
VRPPAALLASLLLSACIEGPVYEREDLARIVLRPAEGLPGTALNERGPESLEDLAPYFGDLQQAGFVAAFGTNLGHEDVLRGEVRPGSLSGREVRGLQSTAILFETADGAEAVLQVQREAIPEGPFELQTWLSAEGLGEEGFGARARSPHEVSATLFQWRRGNLLLALNVFGEFSVPEVRALAETMDHRAEDALLT